MAEQSRVRRTKAAWAEIMKRHGASGLSQVKFCERVGIALWTFDRWHQRLRRTPLIAGPNFGGKLLTEL